jgi:hypothetical protein
MNQFQQAMRGKGKKDRNLVVVAIVKGNVKNNQVLWSEAVELLQQTLVASDQWFASIDGSSWRAPHSLWSEMAQLEAKTRSSIARLLPTGSIDRGVEALALRGGDTLTPTQAMQTVHDLRKAIITALTSAKSVTYASHRVCTGIKQIAADRHTALDTLQRQLTRCAA